jgi:hypothetical protein
MINRHKVRRIHAYQTESTESKPLDAQDLFLKFERRFRPTTDDKHTQSTCHLHAYQTESTESNPLDTHDYFFAENAVLSG